MSFGAEHVFISRSSLIKLKSEDKNSSHQQQITDPGQAQQKGEGKSFISPPGTEWYDIRIHFVDMNNVEITLGKGRKYERDYKSLGCWEQKHKEMEKRVDASLSHDAISR